MLKKKYLSLITATTVLGSSAISAFAEATPVPGTSLLDDNVKSQITGFAGSLKPTVMDLLIILIPAGLALWAIGFGVKKGIQFLQKKASKAV